MLSFEEYKAVLSGAGPSALGRVGEGSVRSTAVTAVAAVITQSGAAGPAGASSLASSASLPGSGSPEQTAKAQLLDSAQLAPASASASLGPGLTANSAGPSPGSSTHVNGVNHSSQSVTGPQGARPPPGLPRSTSTRILSNAVVKPDPAEGSATTGLATQSHQNLIRLALEVQERTRSGRGAFPAGPGPPGMGVQGNQLHLTLHCPLRSSPGPRSQPLYASLSDY